MPAKLAALNIAILSLVLAACMALDAHQNFKNITQVEVGRPLTDPDLTRNRYRHRLVRTVRLQNGNIEEEYKDGRGFRCRVFFELNQSSGTVVGWRYEGTKDDCAIVP